MAATIEVGTTLPNNDQQLRLTRLQESTRGQFRKHQIFRVETRQEEQRSTKGPRQRTTMQPIKSLLLLAAVLSFAAMYVDAVPPHPYVVGADENGEMCEQFDHMGFEECRCCCIRRSYENAENGVWLLNQPVYLEYGRCVCKHAPGEAAVSVEEYEECEAAETGRLYHIDNPHADPPSPPDSDSGSDPDSQSDPDSGSGLDSQSDSDSE
jgi:hypothetical protein